MMPHIYRASFSFARQMAGKQVAEFRIARSVKCDGKFLLFQHRIGSAF